VRVEPCAGADPLRALPAAHVTAILVILVLLAALVVARIVLALLQPDNALDRWLDRLR